MDTKLLERRENDEWEMWKVMCKKMQTVFRVSETDFNKRHDIKELCCHIGDWAYRYALLRDTNPKADKPMFITKASEVI